MADQGAAPGAVESLARIFNGRIVLRLAAAALLGALAGTGQVPFSMPYLALPALSLGLVLATIMPAPRGAALVGWAIGSGYFALSLHWIVEPFLVDVARHGWMAPFALVFLSGGLALFWAAAFWIGARVRGGAAWRIAATVLALSLAELARGYVLTGFPWALAGYVWTETAVRGWAALVGPFGLTALTFALAGIGAWIAFARSVWQAGLGFGAAAALFVLPAPLLLPGAQPEADRPTIRLVQPNAAQREKWDPRFIPMFLDRQIGYTAAAPAPDLIVWPEVSIPYMLDRAENTVARISDAAGPVPVVVGAQRREDGRAHNALALIGATGEIEAIYDKHHLVPFGEYMPLRGLAARLGIDGLAAIAGGGYWPGPGAELVDLGPLGAALPLICYEAIFPQDVAAAPARPDLLLQITNDAWFGAFSGPYQHLAQARMRAVEQGLPMIRVANTGVSAIIDPAGRITTSIPLGVAGYADGALPAAAAPTIYSRTGDGPVTILLIGGLLFLISAARRKAH